MTSYFGRQLEVPMISEQAARTLSRIALPAEAIDFVLNTHVGDEWDTERYTRRKSADFLASWVITDTDGGALRAKLDAIAASVSAGFHWNSERLDTAS